MASRPSPVCLQCGRVYQSQAARSAHQAAASHKQAIPGGGMPLVDQQGMVAARSDSGTKRKQTKASKKGAGSKGPKSNKSKSSAAQVPPPDWAALPRVDCIDIGANLLDPMYQGNYRGKQKHSPDLEAVLSRARAAGVSRVIVTAGELDAARAALDFVKGREGLYSTVGVHPTRAGVFKECEQGEDQYVDDLLQVAKEGQRLGKVVAIGECGLDFERLQFCDKDTQMKYFEKHFLLTEATGLPMFLHNRGTEGAFVEYIRKHRHRFKEGVVHSFDGPESEMRQLVDLGMHIGINGCSLRTPENIAVAAAVPLDRLMLETDAPWCDIRKTHAGHSHVQTVWPSIKPERYDPETMGETLVKSRNEPCTMRQVLEVVAGAREITVEALGQAVLDNTKRVFFPEKQ